MQSPKHESAGMGRQDEKTEQFVALILANQQRICGFIRSMVPHAADMDDLFQQTSAVLWRKFDEFEPGTNFAAWAMRVAHFQIRDYRKKKLRNRGIFSDELMDKLAEQVTEVSLQADVRQEALEGCLEALSEDQRRIVRMRYIQEDSIEEIAARTERSTKTVYRSLGHIRESLLACIRRKLAEEQWT